MTKEEIIHQLEDLMSDAKTHYTDDGDDEIFRADVEALDVAIKAVGEKS